MAIAANPPRGTLVRNVLGAGRYITGDGMATRTSVMTIVADTLYCLPLSVDVTIDALAMAVTTGAAGAARMGLYNAGENGEPTTLIEEAAVLDTTSIATVIGALAASRRLTQPCWLVMVSNATPGVAATVGTGGIAARNFGQVSLTANTAAFAFTTPFTYAALPAVFPAGVKTATSNAANTPTLAVRTA